MRASLQTVNSTEIWAVLCHSPMATFLGFLSPMEETYSLPANPIFLPSPFSAFLHCLHTLDKLRLHTQLHTQFHLDWKALFLHLEIGRLYKSRTYSILFIVISNISTFPERALYPSKIIG